MKSRRNKKEAPIKNNFTTVKAVFTFIIIFFLVCGIYYKITDKVAQGDYVSRYGDNWTHSVITGNSLLFFAVVFFLIRVFIIGKADKE
jgi:hypothetical protein